MIFFKSSKFCDDLYEIISIHENMALISFIEIQGFSNKDQRQNDKEDRGTE